MKKGKGNNDLIILGALALGGYYLLSGKAQGSGSEGGSFVAPLIPALPGETAPQTRIYSSPESIAAGYSKKEVSSGQFTTPISGDQASQIFQLSSWGQYASSVEKKTGAYPLSPANSPSRDVMAAEYKARAAAYEAGTKKAATIKTDYSKQGGGTYSGGQYGGFS